MHTLLLLPFKLLLGKAQELGFLPAACEHCLARLGELLSQLLDLRGQRALLGGLRLETLCRL